VREPLPDGRFDSFGHILLGTELAILSFLSHPVLLGTSSFTASGWEGSFYPKGMKSSDYLAFYAEHFHTVEVDSTFYACPSARTVANWNARTPESFIFSVKVPQIITHEKVPQSCGQRSSSRHA
jgi:uncharacterized protein YecE (DUF72 family)